MVADPNAVPDTAGPVVADPTVAGPVVADPIGADPALAGGTPSGDLGVLVRTDGASLAVGPDADFTDRLREVSASELRTDVRFERALFRRELYAIALVVLLVVARRLWWT